MMSGKQSVPYHIMVALPPLLTLILWVSFGSSTPTELTVTTYYAQLAMTAITIASVPLLLKYVNRQRCGDRYRTMSLVRMAALCAIAVVNMLLHYLLSPTPAFFYLGVMAWLAMFFAYPSPDKADGQ